MFGFPPILDGNAGIKFTNNADSGFPKPGIREIFYSIKDGNWTDTTVWQTASGRVGVFPTANDDVYVRHIVVMNVVTTINNLFISNQLLIGTTISVNNIQSTGILDMQSNGSTLNISGNNNRIDRLVIPSGIFIVNNSVINYSGIGNQTILPLVYHSLGVTNAGVKSVVADLVINRNLSTSAPNPNPFQTTNDLSGTQNAILDLGAYSLTVNGTTTISVNSYLRKYNSEGNLLFVGLLTFAGSGTFWGLPDFQGAINVELRGGLTNSGAANVYLGLWNTGTGVWRFTTNNQNVTNNSGTINYTNKFEIEDGRTITVLGNSVWTLSDTINGLGATARLTMGASSTLNFATAASVPSMTTGIWDFTTNANTIQYNGNYSATIPSYFTNFHSLTIGGTGTKTLGVNTTLNGNLRCLVNSTLECSTFDLTVNGTTAIGGSSIASGLLSKNGAGNLLFIGNLNSTVDGGGQKGIDFSGNPNVELRGGFTYYTNNVSLNTGTGTWTFTTNDQIIEALGSSNNTFTCDIIISGARTITYRNGTTRVKSVNGTDPNSKLVLGGAGNSNLYFTTSTIMTTGILDITSFANTIGFAMSGNYTIPYTTFSGLAIGGGSTKTLSGNTTLSGNFINIDSTTLLECSTFNLTVNGLTGTSTANGARISKTGAGNLIFVGKMLYQFIDFSGGNPNVEFRNGYELASGGVASTFLTGTGTWTFTTNAQTITNYLAATLNCNIVIDNNIVLTLNLYAPVGAQTFVGSINGNNAASTLRLAASSLVNYQNTTQPMATGILDTSTNLNTFIYGAGNQQVKGNPGVGLFQQYRNLTLNGGGNKTLQGNINVQNTYTVTAPAALVLNGFIKTP